MRADVGDDVPPEEEEEKDEEDDQGFGVPRVKIAGLTLQAGCTGELDGM